MHPTNDTMIPWGRISPQKLEIATVKKDRIKAIVNFSLKLVCFEGSWKSLVQITPPHSEQFANRQIRGNSVKKTFQREVLKNPVTALEGDDIISDIIAVIRWKEVRKADRPTGIEDKIFKFRLKT